MQLEDVGGMLRLPMRAHGLMNGCNFASASVMCNLLSGISVTTFRPVWAGRPEGRGTHRIGSGESFRELVKAFYPEPSAERREVIADMLYRHLPNPFAHTLGVRSKGGLRLNVIKRTTPRNVTTAGDGLTQTEVAAIEESLQRPEGIGLGVQGGGRQWDITVDFLYRDILDMMVALAEDAPQMQEAEARFQHGTYVWRF